MRRPGLLLVLLLAWSCALRLWLATPDPTGSRFWDERFGMENVHGLVIERQIRPKNGFHPGLSYLPQAALAGASEALHRLTGRPVFAVFDAAGAGTPTGYLLCRFLQVVAGTLSLYLTWRIGRRLDGPAVGWLGAFFLAITPWHLRQSAIFKPDILLVLTSLLAFDRGLVAAELPSRRTYAQAGGAIGLALASKFNAGPIAFPLLVAAMAGGGWRCRRTWERLVLAGAASVTVFFLLTPFLLLEPSLYLHDFSRTVRDYAHKGADGGGSHLHVLWHGVRSLLAESFHGPLIGTLGLLGIALLARQAFRDRRAAMVVSYVIGYALLYSLSTLNRSQHNWLPLAPFVALAAAGILVRGHAALAERAAFLRTRRGQAATGLALGVGLTFLAASLSLATYRMVVPTTYTLAGRLLAARLRPPAGRIVLAESARDGGILLPARSQVMVLTADRLGAWPTAALDGADALVFPASRLKDPGDNLYQIRWTARGVEALHVAPVPFRSRGDAVQVLLQPWKLSGPPVRVPLTTQGMRKARLAGRLLGVRRGEAISLEIVLPVKWQRKSLRQVLVQGRPVEARTAGREGYRRRLLTDRWTVSAADPQIVVVLDRPLPPHREIKLELRLWRR